MYVCFYVLFLLVNFSLKKEPNNINVMQNIKPIQAPKMREN